MSARTISMEDAHIHDHAHAQSSGYMYSDISSAGAADIDPDSRSHGTGSSRMRMQLPAAGMATVWNRVLELEPPVSQHQLHAEVDRYRSDANAASQKQALGRGIPAPRGRPGVLAELKPTAHDHSSPRLASHLGGYITSDIDRDQMYTESRTNIFNMNMHISASPGKSDSDRDVKHFVVAGREKHLTVETAPVESDATGGLMEFPLASTTGGVTSKDACRQAGCASSHNYARETLDALEHEFKFRRFNLKRARLYRLTTNRIKLIREAILFVMFWILFQSTIVLLFPLSRAFEHGGQLTTPGGILNLQPDPAGSTLPCFSCSNTMADVYAWMSEVLVPLLDPNNQTSVTSRLGAFYVPVGSISLRQVRVRPESNCLDPDTARKFQKTENPVCYRDWPGDYVGPAEYFARQQKDDIRFPGAQYGVAEIFRAQELNTLKASRFWTVFQFDYISNYGAMAYLQAINMESGDPDAAEKARRQIRELDRVQWVDVSTRALTISFVLYNKHTDIYTSAELLVELPASGMLIPSHHVRPVYLISSLLRTVPALYVVMTVYSLWEAAYILAELLELIRLRLDYFVSFWNVLEATLCGVHIYLFYKYWVYKQYSDMTVMRLFDENSLERAVRDLQHVKNLYSDVSDAMGLMVVAYGLHLFKYFEINPSLYILWQTLTNAWRPIVYFSAVILLIFGSFALGGYILFGYQVYEFHSFSDSFSNLFRFLLGEFNFENWANSSVGSGVAFFICFVILVYLMFQNIFIAIVSKSYEEVYGKMESAQQEERNAQKEHGMMWPAQNAYTYEVTLGATPSWQEPSVLQKLVAADPSADNSGAKKRSDRPFERTGLQMSAGLRADVVTRNACGAAVARRRQLQDSIDVPAWHSNALLRVWFDTSDAFKKLKSWKLKIQKPDEPARLHLSMFARGRPHHTRFLYEVLGKGGQAYLSLHEKPRTGMLLGFLRLVPRALRLLLSGLLYIVSCGRVDTLPRSPNLVDLRVHERGVEENGTFIDFEVTGWHKDETKRGFVTESTVASTFSVLHVLSSSGSHSFKSRSPAATEAAKVETISIFVPEGQHLHLKLARGTYHWSWFLRLILAPFLDTARDSYFNKNIAAVRSTYISGKDVEPSTPAKKRSGLWDGFCRLTRHYLISDDELTTWLRKLVWAHQTTKEWRLNSLMSQGRFTFDNTENTGRDADRTLQSAATSESSGIVMCKAALIAAKRDEGLLSTLNANLDKLLAESNASPAADHQIVDMLRKIRRQEKKIQELQGKLERMRSTSILPDSLRFDELLYLVRQEVLLQWEARINSVLSRAVGSRSFPRWIRRLNLTGTHINATIMARELKRVILDFSSECFDFVDEKEEAEGYVPRPIDTREICGLSTDPAICVPSIVDLITAHWLDIRGWQWPLLFAPPGKLEGGAQWKDSASWPEAFAPAPMDRHFSGEAHADEESGDLDLGDDDAALYLRAMCWDDPQEYLRKIAACGYHITHAAWWRDPAQLSLRFRQYLCKALVELPYLLAMSKHAEFCRRLISAGVSYPKEGDAKASDPPLAPALYIKPFCLLSDATKSLYKDLASAQLVRVLYTMWWGVPPPAAADSGKLWWTETPDKFRGAGAGGTVPREVQKQFLGFTIRLRCLQHLKV